MHINDVVLGYQSRNTFWQSTTCCSFKRSMRTKAEVIPRSREAACRMFLLFAAGVHQQTVKDLLEVLMGNWSQKKRSFKEGKTISA